jgi:hypothetical protein
MTSLSPSTQWGVRVEIKSSSSDRVYVVAERLRHGRPTATYGCSCPGWRGYRDCKHLTGMHLTSCEVPIRPRPRGQGLYAFTDIYKRYDVRLEGFGTPDQWLDLAEEMARGRKRYVPPKRVTPTQASDMVLLGLAEMPADVKDLVRAYRRRARVLHPDVVHPSSQEHKRLHPKCPDCASAAEGFTTMVMAYERLLERYPK